MIMKFTIDAKGKKLGRVASEAAKILMGKNSPAYTRNSAPQTSVEVVNVSGLVISEKKLLQKKYTAYSGYPGGLYHSSLREVVEKKGEKEALRLAIYGMLPTNKLRARMMTKLVIK